jgi:hypothetical protein
MMRGVHAIAGLTGMAVSAVLASSCARALEIDEVIGRWESPSVPKAYDCKAESGTETQPVEITREDGKIYVGAYAWGCYVETFNPLGVMVTGKAVCSEEGGDGQSNPIYEATLILGLTPEDQLIVADDSNVTVLNRCPKAH